MMRLAANKLDMKSDLNLPVCQCMFNICHLRLPFNPWSLLLQYILPLLSSIFAFNARSNPYLAGRAGRRSRSAGAGPGAPAYFAGAGTGAGVGKLRQKLRQTKL